VRCENLHHVNTPSLKPSDPRAEQLALKLGREVIKVDDCIGDGVERAVKALQPGQILVLENVQFYKVRWRVNWSATKTIQDFLRLVPFRLLPFSAIKKYLVLKNVMLKEGYAFANEGDGTVGARFLVPAFKIHYPDECPEHTWHTRIRLRHCLTVTWWELLQVHVLPAVWS
jgi:hypothetical protein